jgi:plastocyanin
MKRIPSSSSADSQPTTSKPNNMGTNQNGLGSQSVPESPSASIAETNEVSIAAGSSNPGQGQGFVPPSIAIETDTTVTWTNNDDALHTVTSGKPEGGNSGTEFDSLYLASGKKFQHDFISTGQYSYYCTLHPFMTGTIYVTATIGSN